MAQLIYPAIFLVKQGAPLLSVLLHAKLVPRNANEASLQLPFRYQSVTKRAAPKWLFVKNFAGNLIQK